MRIPVSLAVMLLSVIVMRGCQSLVSLRVGGTRLPPIYSTSRYLRRGRSKEPVPVPAYNRVVNNTRNFGIHTKRVTAQLNALLQIMGYESFGVEVEFCSEKRIKDLNKEWREIHKPTDVLSFPSFQFTSPEVFDDESKSLLRYTRQLGSIVIAPAYVMEQCYWDKKDFEAELSKSGVEIVAESVVEDDEVCARVERKKFNENFEEVENIDKQIKSSGQRNGNDVHDKVDDESSYEVVVDDDFDEVEYVDAGCSLAMATIFNVEERIPYLLIHSILHLVGYDHETDEDWELMTNKEEEIIAKFREFLKADLEHKEKVKEGRGRGLKGRFMPTGINRRGKKAIADVDQGEGGNESSMVDDDYVDDDDVFDIEDEERVAEDGYSVSPHHKYISDDDSDGEEGSGSDSDSDDSADQKK